MSISRNIISLLIALSVFSMSFPPGPVHTEVKVKSAPEAKSIVMIDLVLVNKTHNVVSFVLYGKSNGGNAVTYNFSANTGQTIFQVRAGKYKGIFQGCNGLKGDKAFNLKSKGKITVTLTCPSKNKPPSKIIIK